ncbi:MAG TPA: malto-oligosyltrehalose trehalohydrolase [Burkholderiales bacterium]|nr:malto-oligosyltrehalose trehalohydrolase [Burkholderiales bacterium]
MDASTCSVEIDAQSREHDFLGARLRADGVEFRVWAPASRSVSVVLERNEREAFALDAYADGYFYGFVPGIGAGARYRYRLDRGQSYPDPCSRFQPEGPHGPSMVVDPQRYAWTDAQWPGVRMQGQVIYELHVGTFTPEGTFDAAIAQLAALESLGITVIELLPVAEFPGRWNWGYDGVDLYAPFHGYGDADALKRFVDAAHERGLGVILDVVYNHLGPDGNYLPCFSPDYFTDRYDNEWGQAINFDGPNSGPVREFFIRNACYWISEFRLDGLRLDATQSIHDSSSPHVLSEITRRVRAAAAPRTIILVAENEPQQLRCLAPTEEGGFGLDAMWNDDFHHCARVALTGRHDGYYHDHRGKSQEFISAIKRGFLFQGQYYDWQGKPRGTPVTDEPAWAFVHFIQNHDQVANTLHGERLHRITSPGRYRTMTALMLLGPQTPMLFMGQEFGSESPFTFFADHGSALGPSVHAGRREFLSQFTAYATPAAQAKVPNPSDEETFRACHLDFSQRQSHAALYLLHRDLLSLRREDPVIARQDRFAIDGAVLSDRAFVLRWFDDQWGDRLLAVNLGDELDFCPAPEPLLAPPCNAEWELKWSSEHPRYEGLGVLMPCTDKGWRLPGESATLLWARLAATSARDQG